MRRQAVWAQRAAWWAVSLLGPRALPGRRATWAPPLGDALWSELLGRWHRELGEFETFAAYQRVQSERPGLMVLLLSRSGPVAFVKLRERDDGDVGNESRALRRVRSFGPRSFSVPGVLLEQTLGDWTYLALEALPPKRHGVPKRPPLDAVVEEIAAALAEQPRPPGVPAHWRPMHGDLTPSNLRELPGGRLVLFDWEDAGWGPPEADAALYRATTAALGSATPAPTAAEEAVDFWLKRLASRPVTNERDRRLARALHDVLVAMRRGPARG